MISKEQSTQEEFENKAHAEDVLKMLDQEYPHTNFWIQKARSAGGAYKNSFVIAQCNKFSGRWYGFVSNFVVNAYST